jgi:mannose-1-phosphate guanylyltransferase
LKAFLLAAGYGTRLRPLTDSIPKCLVPINGRPLLDYWMELLERQGITDVLLNTHYLPEPVRRYADDYSRAVRLTLFHEPELLGSGGTLHACRDFVRGEEQFLILYADNLTDVDLGDLVRFNRENPAALTIGLFHAENPSACGIVQLDGSGRIVEFEEKPAHPKGDLASAGIFVARPELFGYVHPSVLPYDFGGEVLPGMIGQINGLELGGYLRDVGTLENLRRAEREWSELHPDART